MILRDDNLLTYQDCSLAISTGRAERLEDFVRSVINEHTSSSLYLTALDADEYDAERNVGITNFMRFITTGDGRKIPDTLASNIKITSNFFRRLNVQRCTYSLGNGLTFQQSGIMEMLGFNADTVINRAGYFSLIHGVSFLYWTGDHLHAFQVSGKSGSFAPLWDEETANLGAGVRFWQIAQNKPLVATLYTPEGFYTLKSEKGGVGDLKLEGGITPYRYTVESTPATAGDVVTAHNYGSLPIVPMWGSNLHQSTLVGMRTKIDAYDLIKSGFANDLADCAEIYWIISGAGGMNEKDLSEFRQRLLFRHIASVPGSDEGVNVNAYTQEPPYSARKTVLEDLRNQIYEDFGALDVHTVAAGATNDHIDAAYQPMDENADDFEYQVIEAMQKMLGLLGVPPEDATPQFKRNRISNQMEQVEMLVLEAPYLDDETLLKKFPNVSSEEVGEILKRKDAEGLGRMRGGSETPEDEQEEEQEEESGY